MDNFIPISEPNIGVEELELVTAAVKSGWVSSIGEYIEMFERSFADYCGRTYGLATSNGTTAIHLALLALGIGPGDEVIIPNFTFIATANAVTYTGAKSILVDIEPDTWNIDPRKIELKITKNTKAIISVPIYGHSCDMDSIMAIAKKNNLYLIEDAAESHGGKYKGRMVGSFGDISCFSFYGNKTITTGEGGMCLTNNKDLHEKMCLLRDHAMSKERRYWHDIVGYNYRLTNIQAALGVAQLKKINYFIELKRRNAALYFDNLKSLNQIVLPVEKDYAFHTYWMYSILIKNSSGKTRDQVMVELKKNNIDSRPLFYPLSHLPPYKINDLDLKVSEAVAYQGLSLPSSTKLAEKEIVYICKILKSILL